jgi:hypothetical protein
MIGILQKGVHKLSITNSIVQSERTLEQKEARPQQHGKNGDMHLAMTGAFR